MKRLLLLLLLFSTSLNAALTATTVWEFNQGATASMVNGGGFSTQNANFLTDLACTDGTTTTPDCTSVSYTFIAGDVNSWIFVRSGTNWNTSGVATAGGGCWWKITAVASGTATIATAIGEGVCIFSGTPVDIHNLWRSNTSAGVATVASPTSGTFGVDYSQGTASIDSGTDLASSNGTTAPCAVTSVTHNFTSQEVGNVIHITAGTSWTVGWYEIVSTAANAATLDRACGSAASISGGTWALGGALSYNSTLDDDWGEQLIAGNAVFWIYSASAFVTGEAINIAKDGDATNGINMVGYNTIRSDNPTGANRPTINGGANTFIWAGDFIHWYNLIYTGTPVVGFQVGSGSVVSNIKATNTSGADRAALTGQTYATILNSEFSSSAGTGLDNAGSGAIIVVGSYMHDSLVCYRDSSTLGDIQILSFNIFDTCGTGMHYSGSNLNGSRFLYNTFYGAETPAGTGFLAASGADRIFLFGNIFYGWTTAVSLNAVLSSNIGDYNDYFNNTTNLTNLAAGLNDLAVDPAFTNAAGGDFSIGTALKAAGIPGLFPGSSTTGYLDTGAVQRQESSGGGSYTFVQ